MAALKISVGCTSACLTRRSCFKRRQCREVCIGEDASDPVVGVSDLLIHLAGEQMSKKADKVIEGENLDILVGSMPSYEKKKTEKMQRKLLRKIFLRC